MDPESPERVISLDHGYEVSEWLQILDCTALQLVQAMAEVGPAEGRVREYLESRKHAESTGAARLERERSVSDVWRVRAETRVEVGRLQRVRESLRQTVEAARHQSDALESSKAGADAHPPAGAPDPSAETGPEDSKAP